MAQVQAAQIFRAAYNGTPGVNFMTPTWIRNGKQGKFVYELSTGRGFMSDDSIFGVTVVRVDPLTKEHDLSKCLQSREEAETYIKTLRHLD